MFASSSCGAGPSGVRCVAMRLALLGCFIASLLTASACKKTPSKNQCDQLLAHLIEIEVVSGGAGKVPDSLGAAGKDMKGEVEQQKQAIRDYAIGQKFIESCTQGTPKAVVECGLAAKDAKELAACDGVK